MKKYIPIVGIFIADYPIENNFFFFMLYQIFSIGALTMFISLNLAKWYIATILHT